MQIGECCNRRVVVADRETSIAQAARLMRKYHVGALVVVDGEDGARRPVGMVTDRDLVVEVLAQDAEPEALCVEDVMSDGVSTAAEDDELWDTLERMRELAVRRLPVTDDEGRLTGIISVDDIQAMLAQGLSDISRLVQQEVVEEAVARP